MERRGFLKLFGAAGAAASTLPLGGSAPADEMVAAAAGEPHHRVTDVSKSAGNSGYEFFNVDESGFIEAAVDMLRHSDPRRAQSELTEGSSTMSTAQQELSVTSGLRTVAPARCYSKVVKFINEVAKEAPNDAPTSVEIFSNSGHWYCRVRRGDEKTRPMGPIPNNRLSGSRKLGEC
ncbi:twin-arginine translocation signal domain-containing protein [Mesorhizobium sp.]|uniref:twin-arginine translocation signal domain-containing protein n=1 Tax=Mesorhizobium sp. TaxID=1871066 RepID=UPI0025D5DFFD|nr:twin-arginine translocation signal domain-containing protein [Mesorhizobium sp.]